MKRWLNLMLLFLATGWPLVPAWGQSPVSESVITATFPDRSISALVRWWRKSASALARCHWRSWGLLWVHHADDPCSYTPYWQAKRYADKTRSPLITVKSSNAGRGRDCQAFSRHGYIGAEKETVQAMKQWLVTGVAADVVLP